MSIVEFERPPERRRHAAAREYISEPNRARSRCPELDCLRGRLPNDVLVTAEPRAAALNIGADRVLVTSGHISEEDYARALAEWLHVPFEQLDVPREACPWPDHWLLRAAEYGLLPLWAGQSFIWVVAPQVLGARYLATGAHPFQDRLRLTSRARLREFVVKHGAPALADRAAQALRRERPELSAAQCPPRIRAKWLGCIAAALSASIAFPGLPGRS